LTHVDYMKVLACPASVPAALCLLPAGRAAGGGCSAASSCGVRVQVVAGLEEALAPGKLVLSPLSVVQKGMARVQGLSGGAGSPSSIELPPDIEARSLPSCSL
jgi:hypothetical protein